MDISHNGLPFPVASIEFEKVYMVMDKRIAMGYSDRELSFLLGYRALYVRDVEDPTHTLRYTPKDTNYLLSILDCRLSEIMPEKIAELFYQVKVILAPDAEGNIRYEIFREKNKGYAPYRAIKTGGEPGTSLKSAADAEQVRNYICKLFDGDYFDEPKTSLEIFKKCTGKFGKPLKPLFLMDDLSFYTAKRKSPRLLRLKNESARTVYLKQH